jgi:hypothetical protein
MAGHPANRLYPPGGSSSGACSWRRLSRYMAGHASNFVARVRHMPESSLCERAEEGDLIRVRELTVRPFACRESSIDDMRRRRLCPNVARLLPESVDHEFAFRFATAIATQTSCERTLPRWVNVWVEISKNTNKCGVYSALAEGVGFEPTVPLRARRFSRPVP